MHRVAWDMQIAVAAKLHVERYISSQSRSDLTTNMPQHYTAAPPSPASTFDLGIPDGFKVDSHCSDRAQRSKLRVSREASV